MNNKTSRKNNARKSPPMTPANLDRLFAMMRDWWREVPLAEIARKHGVSRQRVSKLLAGVSCTGIYSRKARRDLPDSKRGEQANMADEARMLLLHPFAWKLTPRQRGALAWRAQGNTLLDAAHRMGCTTQAVFAMLWGAKEKLFRLEYKERADAENIELIDTSGLDALLEP